MTDPEQGERELIERARHDREAFGELYERYVDRIFNYIYYRTGNRHDAEDLTARVFFRAMQHIGNYEDQGIPFSAWLYRIARNMLLNWYRDTGRRKFVSLDSLARGQAEDSPELATELSEDREALLAAIRRLPADRQELLILKFVERRSNAEIGQVLGRSEGAVKSLYYRTLLTLRSDLLETARRETVARRVRSMREGKTSRLSLLRERFLGKRKGG